ncbi:MAG: hypothetical protein ACRBEQ_04725 [Hyphomonas sp.]
MMKRRKSQMGQKAPLFRKVNTRARNVRHDTGGEARWARSQFKTNTNDGSRGSMRSNRQNGLDYTPLFKFLLSHVGDDWDDVYSEAVSRLPTPEPIFWMVSNTEPFGDGIARIGDATFFSELFVDANNTLQKVDPTIVVEELWPSCSCCTHSFNGIRFTQPYQEDVQGLLNR